MIIAATNTAAITPAMILLVFSFFFILFLPESSVKLLICSNVHRLLYSVIFISAYNFSILQNDSVNKAGSLTFCQALHLHIAFYFMIFQQIIQVAFLRICDRRLLFCLVLSLYGNKKFRFILFKLLFHLFIQYRRYVGILICPVCSLLRYMIIRTKFSQFTAWQLCQNFTADF